VQVLTGQVPNHGATCPVWKQ